jgi:hypothetical protein
VSASADHAGRLRRLRVVDRLGRATSLWCLLLGCQQPDYLAPAAEGTKAPALTANAAPALPGDETVVPAPPALPMGEAPPPPGTHFVDVVSATTREIASYYEVTHHVPRVAWPPTAYRHERGMRVRWWAFAYCGQQVSVQVRLEDGVLRFHQHTGVPTNCMENYIAYETTLPPGNDAVHALRVGRAEAQPLPEVLPHEPTRRAPSRGGWGTPDIFFDP